MDEETSVEVVNTGIVWKVTSNGANIRSIANPEGELLELPVEDLAQIGDCIELFFEDEELTLRFCPLTDLFWYRISRSQLFLIQDRLLEEGVTREEIEETHPAWSKKHRAFFFTCRGKEYIIHATTDWKKIYFGEDDDEESEEDHG